MVTKMNISEEEYQELQFKILGDKELRPNALFYDRKEQNFFYIVRVDYDTIIINNNMYNDYMCMWDYEMERPDYKSIAWIKRLLDRDEISFIAHCSDKDECVSAIKELEKNNLSSTLKRLKSIACD